MGCSYIGAVSYFTVCSTRYGVRSGMVTEYSKVTVMNKPCEYLIKSMTLDLRNDIGNRERHSDSDIVMCLYPSDIELNWVIWYKQNGYNPIGLSYENGSVYLRIHDMHELLTYISRKTIADMNSLSCATSELYWVQYMYLTSDKGRIETLGHEISRTKFF